MRMVDLIYKKRHNVELTKEEIEWMINGYTNKKSQITKCLLF